jgi:hypothetical protein
MAHKQIVFPGSPSAFGILDMLLIFTLIVLVVIAIWYIATSPYPKSVAKAELFSAQSPAASKEEKLVVKYVYMNGCPHCVRFDDTHAVVSRDVEVTQKFKFTEKIDIKTANEMGKVCDGFPCYVVYKGSEVVAKESGYKSAESFKNWLIALI